MSQEPTPHTYREEMLKSLIDRHGYLISVRELHRILGFRSYDALKLCAADGTLGIPLIYVEGRRARHAMTTDVAAWLAERWSETRRAQQSAKWPLTDEQPKGDAMD